MSELANRSFLYFLTSVIKSIGLLCLTFFLTPLLLKFIGAADFGTFKVLMEVVGYLSLLELGLYSSLIACLIPLIKNGSDPELDPMLSEGKRQYWKAALLMLGAGAILYPFLTRVTSWSGTDASKLYLTYGMILATTVLIPFQPYKIYLEASNRGHIVNLIIFFQNLSFILIGILFAWLGWDLISQGFAVMASSLIGVLLIRYYSGIKIKSTTFSDPNLLVRIRGLQKPQVLNDFATKICLNCDQVIIGIILGPVMVTKVFLGQRMVLIVQGQLQALGQSAYASLGALYYTDNEVFKKRLLEVTRIVATIGAATLVPICVLNRPFIALWVGSGYQMEDNTLTYLASANAFLYSLFSFWNFVFTVLGKPSEITRMIWWQALINVVASVVLTNLIGGVGPIAGTLVSFLLVPLWVYPTLLKKHFSLPGRKLVISVFFPIASAVAPLTVYHFSSYRIFPQTWWGLILWGISIFSGYATVLFYTLFDSGEKKVFIDRLSKLWLRLKK